MIKTYKNMDINQKASFRNRSDLKKWMLKNDTLCDGLAWGYLEDYEEFQMNMIFIDGEWEVEYYPEFESNVLSFEEAIDEFIKFIQEHNND